MLSSNPAYNLGFIGSLYSRLNNKDTSGIVVAMQRLHLMDLTGFLTTDPA